MNYLKVLTVATAMMALSGCVVAIGDKGEHDSGNNSSWKKAQKLSADFGCCFSIFPSDFERISLYFID